MPGDADDGAPVVLEVGPEPLARAWATDGGPVMEIALIRSRSSGPPVTIRTDRQFLRRALRLGFTELHITRPTEPVCCRDRYRCYVWVPFDPKVPLPEGREVLRLSTADTEVRPIPDTSTRSAPPMSTSSSNGDGHPDRARAAEAAPAGGLGELIAETEALRDLLHDAFSRTTRLLTALKLQSRQSKVVQQAMASLKKLQLDR
jgi:hypothetical protein